MIRKVGLFASAAAIAVMAPVLPAIAKSGNGNSNGSTPVPSSTISGCSATYGTVVSGAIDCQGFFAGNIFSQSGASTQQTAVAALGGSFGGTFGSLTSGSLSGSTVSFGKMLYGQTIVGMHFGNIANPDNLTFVSRGNNENVSVLWLFDLGATGASGITLLNTRGFSNAALYSTAAAVPPVPEPSTWAMLILGFGVVGGAMRAARTRHTRLAFG